MTNIRSHKELRVYQAAIEAAMTIFEVTRVFPPAERYSMVDQIRRSSRSVCANLAEAWRKRRYPAHFVSKLNDAEGEAEETRVWIELALRCHYLTQSQADDLDLRYDQIIGQIVRMESKPAQWTIRDNGAPTTADPSLRQDSPRPRVAASPRQKAT